MKHTLTRILQGVVVALVTCCILAIPVGLAVLAAYLTGSKVAGYAVAAWFAVFVIAYLKHYNDA